MARTGESGLVGGGKKRGGENPKKATRGCRKGGGVKKKWMPFLTAQGVFDLFRLKEKKKKGWGGGGAGNS